MKRLAAFLLPALLLWAWRGNPFLFDDYPTVLENPRLRDPANLVLAWTSPLRAPVYALHTLEFILWGADPVGFRTVNLLFHGGIVWLLFLLARRILDGKSAAPEADAATAALLFACHPLALATAATVSARADLMAAFFGLLMIERGWRFLERRRTADAATAAAASALSLLSKPSAAGVLLLAAGAAARRWDSPWRTPALLAAAATMALALLGPFRHLAGQTLPVDHWAAQTAALPHYVRLVALPTDLTIDRDARPAGAGAHTGGLLLLAAAAAAIWRWRRRRPLAAGAGAWFLAALAPAALAPLGDTILDTRAYLAVAGPAVAAAAGLQAAPPRTRRRLAAAVFLFLLLQGAETLARRAEAVSAWSDNVRRARGRSRVHANLGEAFRGRGDFRRAAHAYRVALGVGAGRPLDALGTLSPAFEPLLANLGYCLLAMGDAGGAILAYQKAFAVNPANVSHLLSLGSAFASRGEFPAAEQHLAVYVRRRPEDADAWRLWGVFQARAGKAGEAERTFRALLASAPEDPALLNNLANVRLARGAPEEARALYEQAAAAGGPAADAARKNLWRLHAARGEDEAAAALASALGASDRETLLAEPIWR